MTQTSGMVLYEGGLEFRAEGDNEPRIRDLDLAERLGYERAINIRLLIRENETRLGIIFRRQINHDGGRGRPGVEFWLTERQALFITTQSRTERAADISMMLVDAFIAIRKQIEHDQQALKSLPRRLVEAILLPAPAPWAGMFGPSLVRALCALHGVDYNGGPHPRFLQSTNRKIYELVFTGPLAREIKARNPIPRWGSNHHQHLTEEAKDYFRAQLKIVEAIARQSAHKADFWRRMDREYANGMLQLALDERQ